MKKLFLILALAISTGVCYAHDNGHGNDSKHHGQDGQDGKDGRDGKDGKNGLPGLNGTNGVNGKDADQGYINDLAEKKYTGKLSLRLFDSKRLEAGLYDTYDFRHGRNHELGVYANIKIGKSYEERLIEKLEKQIDLLMAVAHRPTSKLLEYPHHHLNKAN